MDISHIPRSFWHAISFCIVVATLGLLYLAYISNSVSIEIANAKIELSSAISQVKEVKSDLAEENERLVNANNTLKTKLKKLEEKAANSTKGISLNEIKSWKIIDGKNGEVSKLLEEANSSVWLKAIDSKIQSAEQAIKK